MITLLVYLLVILIVMALGWWILSQIPLPPPIGNVARVVFVVICAIVLIVFLLNLVGGAGMEMSRLR
jgi:hypothetical protein